MIGCEGGDCIKRGEVNKGGEEERKGMKGGEEASEIWRLIQDVRRA